MRRAWGLRKRDAGAAVEEMPRIPLGLSALSVSGARPMGHNKGKDNVKKRIAARKKNDRLALAKSKPAASK